LLAALRPERPREGPQGHVIRPSYADIDGHLAQFEGILNSESVKETLRVAKGSGAVPEGMSLLLPPPGVDPAFDEVTILPQNLCSCCRNLFGTTGPTASSESGSRIGQVH
jgi:hypothetical protein